jgi:hypothetical protein
MYTSTSKTDYSRRISRNQVANEPVQQNVPGARGSQGERVGNAIVSIDAGCNPAQWLPWDVCFKQFYNVSISPTLRGAFVLEACC